MSHIVKECGPKPCQSLDTDICVSLRVDKEVQKMFHYKMGAVHFTLWDTEQLCTWMMMDEGLLAMSS